MYDFHGEAAFDACADIAAPFFRIVADPEIQKLQKANASVADYVEPAFKKHKADVLAILARLATEHGVTPDEYTEKAGLLGPAVDFVAVLTSPITAGLFSSQSQTDRTSSGSATENTEVEKK